MPWKNDRRLSSGFGGNVSVPEEWSDEEAARAVRGAPQGKRYAGYIRGSQGVTAVYGGNVEPGGQPAPAVSAADVAREPVTQSMAEPMQPRVTAREVLYGARATNPNADSGRLGSEQRRWERYLAGRANRVSPMDRPRGGMAAEAMRLGRRDPDSTRAMAAVTAADIAGRTSAMLGQKQADRDLARQVKMQDANISMGRFMMDMDDAAYKRSLRPMDETGRALGLEGQRQGIMGQIQARQLEAGRAGREEELHPLKVQETTQQMEQRKTAEARAQAEAGRASEKWTAEKSGWAVGQGMPAPGAGAAPEAAPAAAGGAFPQVDANKNLPPIMAPADARKLPKGTLFRTPDGRTLRVP